MNETNSKWDKYTKFIRRFDWLIIILSIVLFAISFNFVKQIRVRSDFKAMLPDNAPSVIHLKRIEEKVRGTDNLLIIIGGSKWSNIKRFIDDYIKKIETELGDKVMRIEYNVASLKEFYEKNRYHYIDLPDLKEIYNRLKRKIDHEKLKELPFYLDFGDKEPDLNLDDIQNKYESKTSTYRKYHDNYFTNKDGTLATIIIFPKEGSTNVEFAKKLIDDLGKLAQSMDPKKYDPELKVAFGGRLRKMIVEYKAIVGDILKTTILCMCMVGLVVLGYFRKIRMGVLMTVNVAQGTLMALAIAFLTIGYLTSQTAFLGAIIVGNGIDFSLIFMSRYIEERREKQKSASNSMSIAMANTWRPTITSSLTTAVAFLALTATQIKGFSQFGFIGGIGMPLCWLSTFFFLPAWLSISEKIRPIKPYKEQKRSQHWIMSYLSTRILGNERRILKLGAALIISCILFAMWYFPSALEYNFEKLNFKKPKEESSSWEYHARRRAKRIFGGKSTTPSVVLTDNVAQAEDVCKVVDERDKALGGGYVEKCQSLASFLPEDQKEKLNVLLDISLLLKGKTLQFLNKDQKNELNTFTNNFDPTPVMINELPGEIMRSFTDVDGKRGTIAFVYPQADLWDGHELVKFANIIRDIDLPSGKKIYSSGHPVIMSDLLKAIVTEGPRVTLLSLFLVMFLVWINFRKWTETAIVIGSLVTGVILLIGFLEIVGIKLNFLNFVALPITFGIGVDYAVNIYQRFKQDNFENLEYSLSRIGSAVIFCSSTTTIGYSVLLTSRSKALVTFGLVALLGEIACLLVAVFILPCVIKRLKDADLLPFEKNTKAKDILFALVKSNKHIANTNTTQNIIES